MAFYLAIKELMHNRGRFLLVSLVTRKPDRAAEALVEYIRYPRLNADRP